MKILIIAPSRKMGGIERALSVLANEWVNQGINIVYLSCLKNDHFYLLDPKIKVVEPSFKRFGGFFNKLMFYPRLLLFLRSTVKKNNPDSVLVYGDWFSPIALLALLNTDFPVYISDRTIPNYRFKFPIPQLKKWLYPKSAGFIAQTQHSKEYKMRFFGNKLRIQVIPNALPEFLDEFESNTKREKKIIYVGRFAWEKDPEILIRSMVLVSKKYPEWKLEMAGTGPLLEPIKLLVKALNLESNVVFLGNVNKVAKLYNTASLLVLPSVVEGFPNTLIEAMSFGLPCICFTDIPYENIITDNETGFVVPQRLPKLLAETIEKNILDSKLRALVGTKAKASVNRFAKDKIAQEILEFIKI
jgi:GalNAc-alpha-(1->4)-GalNAc-alpha-(1->3)-diNAcBac-PP-undecaprenol alpha-1,4-N-acetyl-D-galactosaminyltransferase